MSDYDVVIVGLGGMGSATAHRLAARGQRVLGIERFTPGHDLGSSHGQSRIIREAYAEHPAYVPLVRRAYELWREVERERGRQLLTVTGGIMLGAPDSGLVAGARLSAERWGVRHEIFGHEEVRRRFPTINPGDGEIAVYEPQAGFVRPEQAVLAHGDLATQLGAVLRYGERVTGWRTTTGGVRVTTDRGVYAADRLVLCAGAWTSELLDDLGIRLTVERQVMHWFEPRGGIVPFAWDRHPVFMWEEDPASLVYGVPADVGDTSLKVAFYYRPGPTGPDEIDRNVSRAEVDEIAEHAARRFPDVAGRHVRSTACMYTLTPDHHFVLGVHPRQPRVVVACGFSGHGFKFVPVVGEIIADLVVDGSTAHDISLFDPARVPTA